MKKDLKNKLSTIFGVLAAICGAMVTASQTGLVLPEWVIAVSTAVGALSVAVIGILTGKNPDLSAKTSLQIENQLDDKERSKNL